MRPALRASPYPYRAILAICSDLDETPSRQVYEDTARFLNTDESVGFMGEGVGLEVGNSMYFDMPPDQFSYWNTDEDGREMVRRLIRSGHIDCFHSYGDLATTRAHAGRALDDLSRHGCAMAVWIDHAVAPTNFGADIMRGSGDVPGHPAYHADLTCQAGVRYVWRGRVTSVIGQDVPRSLGGLLNRAHPVASVRTVAKEWIKGALGRVGNEKYAIHPRNEVLRSVTLRDGRPVLEFLRANPNWESVTTGETATGFAGVVHRGMLDRLVERGGVQILYTHLGKVRRVEEPLEAPTRTALRLIAEYSRAEKILVTTTRRALELRRVARGARVSAVLEDGKTIIDVQRPPGSTSGFEDVDGLTVYCEARDVSHLRVDGQARPFAANQPDHTGQASVSIPWRRLRFPS